MLPHRIIARAFVLNRQGDILLVTHAADTFWYTPGGHPEAGESLPDCARREVFEESGVSIEVGRLVSVDEWLDTGSREHKLECYFLASTEVTQTASGWRDTGGLVKQARFFGRGELASLPAVFPSVLLDVFWTRLAAGFAGYDPYRSLLAASG